MQHSPVSAVHTSSSGPTIVPITVAAGDGFGPEIIYQCLKLMTHPGCERIVRMIVE
jgi:hypothetical protein